MGYQSFEESEEDYFSQQNNKYNAGMSFEKFIRNLRGDIKSVADYSNLELKRKISRDKNLGVTGIWRYWKNDNL